MAGIPACSMSNGITDIRGLRVGHFSDPQAATGCTVILAPDGAVGGVDIRGSATGTVETPVLAPGHVADRVHAVVLAGGSAFGLEASSGVRLWLRDKGIGFKTSQGPVPIVAGAILYDLSIGDPRAYATLDMGRKACEAASDGPVTEGSVGAGTGATVGKVAGMNRAMKAGVGTHTIALNGNHTGVLVSALSVVNAVGDVVDQQGNIVAGTRITPDSPRFANSESVMARSLQPSFGPTNTTLTVVATNARLDHVQATQLAQAGSLGMARTLRPANTIFDGDITFALSLGDLRVHPAVLGSAAAEAVSQSILRAVRNAKTLAGIPGLG